MYLNLELCPDDECDVARLESKRWKDLNRHRRGAAKKKISLENVCLIDNEKSVLVFS